jgi:hypothetical protein
LPTLQLSNPTCEANFLTYKVPGQTEPGNNIIPSQGVLNDLPGAFFEITGIPLGVPCNIVVSNSNTGCQSSGTTFLSTCPCPTVNNAISTGDQEMCAGSTVPVLSVTVSNPATETADWFDVPTGGFPLNVNGTTSFQPTPPLVTTSYYAQARLSSPNIDCSSAGRAKVDLVVRPRPTANAGLDQDICSGDTLDLTGIITDVSAGFWAANGGQFLPDNGAFSAQQYVPEAGATQAILTLVTENPIGPCLAASDEMVVNLLAAPVLSAVSADCAQDFQTYSVVFSSNTNILNTVPGPPVSLGNNQYRVSNIPINQQLKITGVITATGCDRSIDVAPPIPCPCPNIAAPVSTQGNFLEACFGSALPTITVNIPSGTIANWYLSNTGTTAFLENARQFTPSLPGDYFVEAVDTLNNCPSARIKITVSIKPAPVISLGPNARFCPGKSVALSGDVGAGYTYNWSGGQTSQNITVTQAGLYLVTVTLNGCSVIDSFQVTTYPDPSTDISIVDSVSCFGATDGKLMANLSGGTPPVSAYSWSTQSGLSTLTGVGAGTYTVTVVDNAGCSASATLNLEQPALLGYNNVVVTPSSNSQATGSIMGQTFGGTQPYQYQWQTLDSVLAGQTGPIIDSIGIGNYILVIRDANGCAFTSPTFNVGTVDILEPGLDQFIQLFPNPTTGRIQVKFSLPTAALVEIAVLDMLGRQVLQTQPTYLHHKSVDVDLSTFTPGLYWVKIRLDDKVVMRKVSVFR